MFHDFYITHELDTVDLSLQYGQEYMLSYGKGPLNKETSWRINSSIDSDIPFECTNYFTKLARQIYTPKGYKDTVYWNKEYQSDNLELALLPILSFTENVNSYRMDSVAWFNYRDYYQPFIDYSMSRDFSNSLNSIADILLGSNGPSRLNNYFNSMNPKDATSKMKMYFINNSSSFKGELKINLTFTEQQLEQIKGFKLQKIN
jgi:hypothetical protein